MPSLPSTPRKVPSGHGTKSSILYLHSLGVRPMMIVRLLNVRTTSSEPEVTYNMTIWHVPSKHSSAAPTPALVRLQNQYHTYIIMLWKYHGHKGRGTTTACLECGSTALGAPDFVISFFLLSGLHYSEDLSDNTIAEHTMQHPGR